MAETTIQEKATAVRKLFGTAATLARKQAELATLNTVTLPKLYHAIGKRIVGLEKLPAELEHHRRNIRQLEAGIAETPEETKSDPAGGFAAKAKQFAQQAAQTAAKVTGDAAAGVQIQAAYVSLGKEAVDKYGEKAVPKELVGDVSAANATRTSLQEEIASLRNVASIGFLSPKRLVLGIGICAALGVVYWMLPKGRPSAAPTPTSQPAIEPSEMIATRTATRTQAAPPTLIDSGAAIARFEAECDKLCSGILSTYRAAGSPRDIVSSCREKLDAADKRMDGTGIPAGCAKATIGYLGGYGLLVVEAAGRSGGQEAPGGGLVAMYGSGSADADKSVLESGDAAKYWTHVACIRSLIQLNAESNAFHADFKRQFIELGSQPAVFVELQRMRRDIGDLLLQRYSACVKAGIRKYGPPTFSDK